MAKLLVPLGAPLQLNAGEIFPPVHPNPLNTCSLAMLVPSLSSVLVKVISSATAALAPNRLRPSAAKTTRPFEATRAFMVCSPLVEGGAFCFLPADTSHSNFRDGAKASDGLGEKDKASDNAFIGS